MQHSLLLHVLSYVRELNEFRLTLPSDIRLEADIFRAKMPTFTATGSYIVPRDWCIEPVRISDLDLMQQGVPMFKLMISTQRGIGGKHASLSMLLNEFHGNTLPATVYLARR